MTDPELTTFNNSQSNITLNRQLVYNSKHRPIHYDAGTNYPVNGHHLRSIVRESLSADIDLCDSFFSYFMTHREINTIAMLKSTRQYQG